MEQIILKKNEVLSDDVFEDLQHKVNVLTEDITKLICLGNDLRDQLEVLIIIQLYFPETQKLFEQGYKMLEIAYNSWIVRLIHTDIVRTMKDEIPRKVEDNIPQCTGVGEIKQLVI